MLDLGCASSASRRERGLEQYLLGKAHEAHKPIIGLETLAMQIGIFDALPRDEQQAHARADARTSSTKRTRTMSELADGVARRAPRDVERGPAGDFDDFPGLYETLVTKRNAAWVDAARATA